MITNNQKDKSVRKFREKTIRFRRKGERYYPVYDIVVVYRDRKASTGKEIEKLGFFNPQIRERQLFINTERLAH
jgi:ribosomal protein S16